MSTSNPENEQELVEQELEQAGQEMAQSEEIIQQAEMTASGTGTDSPIEAQHALPQSQVENAEPAAAAALREQDPDGAADSDKVPAVTHPSDTEGPKLDNVEPATASQDAREAARAQAPIATDRNNAIVGDSGLYEQQPVGLTGSPDEPHRQAAPPATLQSGIPLPEDRVAGVTPAVKQ